MYYTTPVFYCKFRNFNDVQMDVWLYLLTEEWEVWVSAPVRIPQSPENHWSFVLWLHCLLILCNAYSILKSLKVLFMHPDITIKLIFIHSDASSVSTSEGDLYWCCSVLFCPTISFVLLHPLLSDHFTSFVKELFPLQTELNCFLVLHALSWVTPELLTFSKTQSWSY